MSMRVTVVGAANVDITASPLQAYRPGESIPSHVAIDFGGVGRNIAHNLRLLGAQVRFLTVFGSDTIARALLNDCRRLGMAAEPPTTIDGARSNYFVCINDERGEMQAGAADMDLMAHLTPTLLDEMLGNAGSADAVVADCNISSDVLLHLSQHCNAPLYVDATSVAKAPRVLPALAATSRAPITLKVNHAEAEQLTACPHATAEVMARRLIAMGAHRVYITLGGDGVYCHDGTQGRQIAAQRVDIVNATGAGDAFMAAVVRAELLGRTMQQAAEYGQRAAAITLQSTSAVSKQIRQITNSEL